ncbi:hypothetical protein [Pseudomonas chlororaphis]|uniref:hypothetical protein n=1 Tax=Pseudomonas chlororaphis TaxID=587753 RepID=UPI00046FB660|nr:hypothetical protein [Pseudomonas chlororaphis]
MNEILKNFLEEGKKLFETMPIDFFPDPQTAVENYGIVQIYFTKRAYFKGLLKVKNAELETCFRRNGNFQEKLIMTRKVLGEELLPGHFTEEGKNFALAYSKPGWRHYYLFSDFGNAFPNVDGFEKIPDSEKNYKTVESIFNQRFGEWVSTKSSQAAGESSVELFESECKPRNRRTLPDKSTWLLEMDAALSGPRDEKSTLNFHDLVYQVPAIDDREIVDILMRSFLAPFESSVMQGCVTMLSGVDFDLYYDAYFKVLPQLLEKDPDTALSLLDYPGYELDENHIEMVILRLHEADSSGKLKKNLDCQIQHWNLADDEPWSTIYHFE